MTRRLAIVLALLALGACARPPPYRPGPGERCWDVVRVDYRGLPYTQVVCTKRKVA